MEKTANRITSFFIAQGAASEDDRDIYVYGLVIALDGNVFPCQMFTDDKFIIGNVYSQTLSEILNGERLSAFIVAVHGRKGNIEQCKPCGYKGMCAGGCPAQAYAENQTIYSVSARCRTRKNHFNERLIEKLRAIERSGATV
jgi:radical SAM protein with 4Fe4S-binding SPASM domain